MRWLESVNVAPRLDCITTSVAIAAQYASGIWTRRATITDAVAARAVRTECPIEGRFSFCQLQSFMPGMILLANQSWQDRVQEKFSILSEMSVFECLRKATVDYPVRHSRNRSF